MQVILFPGQGAQTVGMGRDFFESSPAARALFEEADEALGVSLSKVCFEGPKEKLSETDVCQPAILTCSAAIVATLQEREGLRREDFGAAAGLSLGEYTALWFAGALSFADAVRLVRARGRAMQAASEASPSGMSSLIGADADKAKEACEAFAEGEVLQPANFLCPGNIAVSGAKAALERLAAGGRELGVRRVIPLDVAGAFHSPLMQPAVAMLEEALAGVDLGRPQIPVISNVTAVAHDDVEGLRRDLLMQVTAPVRWEDSMRGLIEGGATTFLEPGPGNVLSNLLRKIDKGASARNVQSVDEVEARAEGNQA